MRSLILRSIAGAAPDAVPTLSATGTGIAGEVTWAAGTTAPFAAIVGEEGFDLVRDETTLGVEARRALFLDIFPIVAFGGTYIVAFGPAGGELDPAFAALGSLIAKGAIQATRARLVHGQTATAYAEVMSAAVSYRPGEVAVTKSASEGAPLRIMRAVSPPAFPGEWEEVLPVEPYARRPAEVFDNPPWLAPRLADAIARGGETPRAGAIGILRDVTVVGDGIVHDRRGRILAESLQNIAHERVIPHFYRLDGETYSSLGWKEPAVVADHPNLVLLKQAYDGNYGHWIMETLPRLGLVAERIAPEACHVLVMGWHQPIVPIFKDSLRWCGISEDRVIVSTNGPIEVPRGIFPTPISRPPWVFAPFAVRYLESLVRRLQAAMPEAVAAAPKRIYLSRNRFGRRRLVNEDEVVEFLTARGFQVIYPEQLTFTEQLLAICGASHVVANMGAALTNLAFAPRGVQVLALATEHMPDDFFWDITSQKDGRYMSLHGKATEPGRGMQSDFTLDMARLRAVFADFAPGQG